MALDIGRLVGYLDLDDSKFEGALGGLEGKISGKTRAFAATGLVAGAAIAGALVTGLNGAMDLEQANAKLAGQLDLTKDQSATAGKVAGDLYANNYGESLEGTTQAVGHVIGSIDGMKDASARSVEDITGKLLTLQSAFEIDTARSAQVAGQMVKSGLADNASEAVDLMTASLQKVPPALRENILDAVDEYGPVFQSLGFSGEQAMGALVKGAEKGEYGIDKAGDAVKEFSIRATDMSKASGAAYNEIGLNQEDMSNKLLAGGDTAKGAFKQIVDGLKNIDDPATRANSAIALFGTPLEDLGVNQIPTFLDSLSGAGDGLGKVAGSADELSSKINSGANVSIDAITRKFQGFLMDAVQPLLPILSDLLTWFSENPAAMNAVAVVAGILALAFIGLTVATWAMNTALLANPITWIVLAIVAAVALLVAAVVLIVQNWGPIVEWITGVFGAVWTWLGDVIQGFVDWWNGVWGTIGEALVNGFTAAMTFLQSIPGLIIGLFAAAGTWLLNLGRNLFMGWYQGNLAAWAIVWGFITSIGSRIIGALAAAGSWLISTGGNVLRGMYNGITGFWGTIGSFLAGIAGRVIGALAGAASWLVSAGSGVLRGFLSGITGAWGAVGSFFGGIGGKVLSALGNLGSTLLGAGGDLMRGLLAGIRGGLGNILGAIGSMAGDIMGKFKSMLGIHSPSTVFRGFGQNIGEGLLLGLADLHPEVALGIQNMANLQPSSATAYTYANAYNGRTTINVENMGYDPEEIVDEMERREQETSDLMGLETLRVGL
ncbi:tape measure protein [Curtobacterium phage Parvaparticeps]|nr:tape measure protein [Curtobacterium phage Parvaparticeps]